MLRLPVAFALIGGALLGSAFSVEAAWPGVFVGVAALVLSLESSATPRQAAFHGAIFGWAGYVGGFFWLQPTLAAFWGGQIALSWAVWLAWGCWVSLRFVVIAWGYRALRLRRFGIVPSLLLPWLTVEWIYPSVFPFYLAGPLVDHVVLAQAAALGGPILLSAWAIVASAVVAESLLWILGRCPKPRAAWSALLGASLALGGYGLASMHRIERDMQSAPAVTVGLVQANVDVMAKRTERVLSHRRHLEQSRPLAAVDLLIWPETSYLHALPREIPTSGAAVIDELDVPLLFGGVRKDAQGRRFNSALLVDSDGRIRSAYDKRFLIPFAEFVPFADRWTWWKNTAPTLSRFHAGDELAALRLGDWNIATPICYETIRPGYVGMLVRETNPHLLVSLANDGWFGDSPEPRIHLRLARFRAIEHRRYLVRATNTGISAIIDPLGRVVGQTRLFEAETLRREVHMLDDDTIYTKLGDWPGYASAIALLVAFVIRRRP